MNEIAPELVCADTARGALAKVRSDLNAADIDAARAMSRLHEAIILHRPGGVLTVAQIAAAIGRDRSYVDSVWSTRGGSNKLSKGRQLRVAISASPLEAAYAEQLLDSAARDQRARSGIARVFRAERNRVVSLVYASKILGPSAIAEAVGVDRNHVLRIARKSKVAPVWRPAGVSRNQHTTRT